MTRHIGWTRALAAALLASALAAPGALAQGTGAPPALKEELHGAFRIGVAINLAQIEERDTQGVALIERHFDATTPENILKWESVHPAPGRYAFDGPDRYVAFGEKRGMFVVGHTLVWHNQTPRWVFQDSAGHPVSRDTLLARMKDHIFTVVGRYRGRVKGWDVVNEALNEDGTLRQSPWLKIIGEDYIAKAFQFAHEADPAAELYYNDYSLANPAKRAGAVALVRKLQAQGIPVAGIGMQGHYKMDWPTPAAVDSTIAGFAKLGIKVMITELDVDVLPAAAPQYRGADVNLTVAARKALNPYPTVLPDSVQQALARRYAELFTAILRHRDVVSRVTFWGVDDADSWLNDWPVRGRTSYPLLFDRAGRPKPAFDAVVDAVRRALKPPVS
ncbi:MAG TPA: endo-1,4-beta-xylanase [Longimicrobiales bacterium]|nr:endo-1,4-beta-xylanase [Longimicrobiales bacterium]